jgi:hypothetical protein
MGVFMSKALFNELMAYEDGELDTTEIVELFSKLVRSGMAWQLQGMYGRQAMSLINSGYLDKEGNILERDNEE